MKTEEQWMREEIMAKNKRIKELLGEKIELEAASMRVLQYAMSFDYGKFATACCELQTLLERE